MISALGVGLTFKSHNLIARAMPRLVAAMETQRVSRLIFTSAFWRRINLDFSRADVAAFLLSRIDDPTYVRKTALISS